MGSNKPIHTIVLDTGAIIKNEPPVSTLVNQSQTILTVPSIISEIKDSATRSRVETTLRPFLTLRSPSPISVKFVTDFARRTGDLAVLSKADIHIIALTYEIECEKNGGDWRLRRVPGQKRLNGSPPSRTESGSSQGPLQSPLPAEATPLPESSLQSNVDESTYNSDQLNKSGEPSGEPTDPSLATSSIAPTPSSPQQDFLSDSRTEDKLANSIAETSLGNKPNSAPANSAPKVDSAQNSAESREDSDSDSDGWITPSNLRRKQAEDAVSSTVQTPETKTMQVALLTTDFAMQNVTIQMNLNLMSPSLARVKHLKTFVLRCHACFQVTKDTSKQFCPRCGQPSLTRVSCSTSANGEVKLHLKKNVQWNHRGDRYSIPKPVHGSANGRVKGAGKGSWGNELILAEDQKEYQRAPKDEKKQGERNLMDEDYLPSILTGARGKGGGRVKVGAGRNVNARKR